MNTQSVSFYMLEVSSAGETERYIYNNIVDIKQALTQDLANLKTLLCDERKIYLLTINNGILVEKINLLPSLTISIGDIFNAIFEDTTMDMSFISADGKEYRSHFDTDTEAVETFLQDKEIYNKVSDDLKQITLKISGGSTAPNVYTAKIFIQYPPIISLSNPISDQEDSVMVPGSCFDDGVVTRLDYGWNPHN